MNLQTILTTDYDKAKLDNSSLHLRLGYLVGFIFGMEQYLEHLRGCEIFDENEDGSISACTCGLQRFLDEITPPKLDEINPPKEKTDAEKPST